MKKIKLLIFLFISLNAVAEQTLFKKANSAYSNDSIAKAITLYDSILVLGKESPELYYNLGNCHYKNKNWANAIWYYEKSLKLNKTEEAKENLTITKHKIVDRIEPLPEIFYKRWWKNIQTFLNETISAKNWQYLTISSILLALCLLISNILLKKNTKKYFFFFFTTSLLAFLITEFAIHPTTDKKEGIVFSPTVTIKSAPSTNSPTEFTLHAGTKIEIVDSIQDWIYIKIPNKNKGWVLQSSIKEL